MLDLLKFIQDCSVDGRHSGFVSTREDSPDAASSDDATEIPKL